MKKCPKCGNEINDNAAFCSFCGESLKAAEEAKEEKSDGTAEPDPEGTGDQALEPETTDEVRSAETGENGEQQPSATESAPNPEPAPGPHPGPGPRPGNGPGPIPRQGSGDHAHYHGNYHQEPYGHPHPSFDPRDHTREFDPWDIDDNRLVAVLPYLFSVFGMIAAVLIQDSPFVRFHLKNEIRLTVAAFIACIVCLVPFIGWFVGGIFLIILCVLKVIVIIQVLSGKAKEIPFLCTIDFLK